MTATAQARPRPLAGARRREPASASRSGGLEPTPLYTRHMLGAIEADRDQRPRRRVGSPARRRPAVRAVHPRLTAASESAASVRMERPDLERRMDDGGYPVVFPASRAIATSGVE
jgi:hypothetical protein